MLSFCCKFGYVCYFFTVEYRYVCCGLINYDNGILVSGVDLYLLILHQQLNSSRNKVNLYSKIVFKKNMNIITFVMDKKTFVFMIHFGFFYLLLYREREFKSLNSSNSTICWCSSYQYAKFIIFLVIIHSVCTVSIVHKILFFLITHLKSSKRAKCTENKSSK